MISVECPACHLSHAVVLSTKQAHAGRTVTQRVRVPVEDAYGVRRGHRWEESGHWEAAGSAVLSLTREGTWDVYSWTCVCGQGLSYQQPAVERVPCTHNPGRSGRCVVADRRTNPPADLYVNPRHGASCPCCGLEGAHWVRVDRAPDSLPLCMR